MLTHDDVAKLMSDVRDNMDISADAWGVYVPIYVSEALDTWFQKLHSEVPMTVILPPEIKEAASILAKSGYVPQALALVMFHANPRVSNEVAVDFVNKEFLGM